MVVDSPFYAQDELGPPSDTLRARGAPANDNQNMEAWHAPAAAESPLNSTFMYSPSPNCDQLTRPKPNVPLPEKKRSKFGRFNIGTHTTRD